MNNNETISVPTYISLCSGYDGIGSGLKRAIPNLRTIAHCEIEAYAVANLIAKMEAGQMDEAPVFTDLKTFPYRELSGRVTVLSAGFPCQPFSSAGKRQATEDPRHLYPWIADGVTAMRPRYVFLENVEGIISAKTGDGESVLKYVLGDLEERGYRCTWGVFSASEVGAPHQRKRVFILAELSNTNIERLEGEASERIQGREGRGEQYKVCEPTRSSGEVSETELGYTKHDGSSTTTNRRGVNQTSYRSEERKNNTSESSGTSRREIVRGLYKTKYPARPGEEQHEWEEPRTVVDSKKPRLQRCRESYTEERREHQEDGAEVFSRSSNTSSSEGVPECKRSEGKTQCELGGTANGTSYRVDRLRLLGNGVVPDTCELAFNTLIQQLR